MSEFLDNCQELILKEQHLILHPQKAVYWRERAALLIADTHFGKGRHFRKNGIPVPQMQAEVDYDRFIGLLLDFQPKEVIFLGDLFHSQHNLEWRALSDLIEKFHNIRFILVKGNHDILNTAHYNSAGIEVVKEPWNAAPFILRHHPIDQMEEEYSIGGHIHPGVVLRGAAHQRLRLPCFYFGPTQAILPAFGSFTGLHTVQPKAQSRVFVIGADRVIETT